MWIGNIRLESRLWFLCTWKIPLSPSILTKYLNFECGGKKHTNPPYPITSRRLYHPSAADLLVAWLIDCSRQVGVRDPDTVHSQTLSMFTSLRITDVGRGGKVWWWVMWDDDGRWCMVRHDEEWWGMMRDDDGWWVGWIDFKTRT